MKLFFYLLCTFIFVSNCATLNIVNHYSEAPTPWDESLGNHRALLTVNQPSDAVILDLEWRRHDKNPDKKKFIIKHKESGDEVTNIHRVHVNNESCKLIFGPVTKPGSYYFYYLPYKIQKQNGFYNKGYYEKEKAPNSVWLNKFKSLTESELENMSKATVVEIQSRTTFDSFYPMEVIALKSEKETLLKKHKNDILFFPEDRKYPIRMLDEMPKRWIDKGPSLTFHGEAQINEYYTFQIGVYAAQKDIENLKVSFSDFSSKNITLSSDNLTCFNTSGIDPYGKPFTKDINISKGHVQPLWIGVDIPNDLASDTYTMKIKVSSKNTISYDINVTIVVNNSKLDDRGDSERWRHSRLRWLNSTRGLDGSPTKRYGSILMVDDNSFSFTGKQLSFRQNGLPGSLKVYGNEILNRPVTMQIETSKGTEMFSDLEDGQISLNEQGIKTGIWKNSSRHFNIYGKGTIEADGYMHYTLKVIAQENITVNDIRLEIPIKKSVAKYMMGMGLPGTKLPKKHHAKWKGPHDSFWVGNTKAGLWCELRGGEYHGPLLNLYKPAHPNSWYNNNKGGFKIETKDSEVAVIVYSGKRDFKANEEVEYEFSFLLTPVKDIDYKSQFKDRYFHNGNEPMPSDEEMKEGVEVINLHHANNYNPHINYPFIAVDSMKWFVNTLHKKDKKVKIYYTIRELSNYATELWALRSLGNEILGEGQGGGYPWLQEHLVYGYKPQWYHWFPHKNADASIVNASGDSRWYNYYIEGLAWLVENVDIDGLYLDDVAFDRRIVKRIRKVMDNIKPGCLLDLHSNTGFSKGPATQYTEYFPYVDKLWFGESFDYDKMTPDNWLVEVSGIPFGHMGDMLHAGGNPWRGMVYGMTVRYPWFTEGVSCDPRGIWKIWDDFGIEDAKMIGYWEDNPPISTDNDKIKITSYVKKDKVLISIASWDDEVAKVKLNFDLEALGLKDDKTILNAPAISNFQKENVFNINDNISIDPTKGLLLILEKTNDKK